MAAKKENLPLTMDQNAEGSSITYANEVIAIIAGVATSEVDGIASMCTSGGISDILGRNKNITRGVKVELGTEETSVDLYVIIEYGTPIQKAAQDAQENVRKAIETMTGLHVVRVDVHVQGVSFEKENKELSDGRQVAMEKLTPQTNAKVELVEDEKEGEDDIDTSISDTDETPIAEAAETEADEACADEAVCQSAAKAEAADEPEQAAEEAPDTTEA